MRSLFWKGMLAFLAVILVAVGTVALLAGRFTESEFRRYTLVHGGMWDRQVQELTDYHATHGSWEDVQQAVQARPGRGPRGQGAGGGGLGPPSTDFQLADAEGRIVADTARPPTGTASPAELERSIPIEVEGQVVGYLLPSPEALKTLTLDSSQAEFLGRVRTALWVATLVALVVALVIGGLLSRSIIAPLRRLTTASQAIAEGDLSARAPVQGQDEVAQLADAFNQMAESLARAEEARRNQTADIAHELRTPLTVLQGTLEAMVDGVYPTDQENLASALGQVRTLARLVEDLRLLALADAGQLQLQAAPLDLRALLQEVVEAHRPRALEREMTLALEMPPALPLVLADRDRLAQVVSNLLENALQYVPPGGHVTLEAARQGQEITVAVSDDGPGAQPEELPYLFERFWRGDPARRRSTGGSGLGLAIARHTVEAHGGRMWAENVLQGGLQISFSLPVA